MSESKIFKVRAFGDLACFTRPEMKVERVSYEVMTPSAARGVFEAILWKPAISWRIHEIAVLKPIQWTSFRRNEVKSKASLRTTDFCADEDRAQRNTVGLKNVDYVISASFEMTGKAGPDDNVAKFSEMFQRRLKRGQHFHQPYLGCREFWAQVEEAPEQFVPIDAAVERPLGRMFYDYDYEPALKKNGIPKPLFFDARLKGGVLFVDAKKAVQQAMEAS